MTGRRERPGDIGFMVSPSKWISCCATSTAILSVCTVEGFISGLRVTSDRGSLCEKNKTNQPYPCRMYPALQVFLVGLGVGALHPAWGGTDAPYPLGIKPRSQIVPRPTHPCHRAQGCMQRPASPRGSPGNPPEHPPRAAMGSPTPTKTRNADRMEASFWKMRPHLPRLHRGFRPSGGDEKLPRIQEGHAGN